MARRGRLVGASIVLVGLILLLAAFFLPWYTQEGSLSSPGASTISVTRSAYLGLPGQNGTIQYTCSNFPGTCPSQTSYSAQNATNVGRLAEIGYFLVIGAIVLALVGTVVGFLSGRTPGRARGAAALAVVALLLAIAAAGTLTVALPGAIGADTPGHTGTGPWSSFWGSNSTTSGTTTTTLTWGAGTGWYLAVGAFVILLAGAIVLARSRREPPPPVPAMGYAYGTPTQPPPAAPPSPGTYPPPAPPPSQVAYPPAASPPPPPARFCPACGASVEAGTRFCRHCGSPLS